MPTIDDVAALRERYGDVPYNALVLYHWRDIDRIDIPDDLIAEITRHGTPLGTIERRFRALRHPGGQAA